MPEYTEHDKLELVKEKSQVCAEFIEWLRYLKGIHLAVRLGPLGVENLGYIKEPVNDLIAEFFNLDLEKLESEKQQMLAEVKRKNSSIYASRELG